MERVSSVYFFSPSQWCYKQLKSCFISLASVTPVTKFTTTARKAGHASFARDRAKGRPHLLLEGFTKRWGHTPPFARDRTKKQATPSSPGIDRRSGHTFFCRGQQKVEATPTSPGNDPKGKPHLVCWSHPEDRPHLFHRSCPEVRPHLLHRECAEGKATPPSSGTGGYRVLFRITESGINQMRE